MNVSSLDRRKFFKLSGAVAGAAGIAATLSACGNGDEGTPSPTADGTTDGGGEAPAAADTKITAGISYELGTNGYDPMSTSGALTVAANWHTLEGLTELDPATREVYAALGTDLPTEVDETTYEVTLRDGAVFHNGDAVTTDDVVFSFDRVLDPNNNSLYAGFLTFLDTVEKKDETTVVFNLKHPFSLVAERLSVVKVVPQAAASADAAAFDMNPIGTGPYVMTDNGAATQKVMFERFDDYTGPRPALAASMEWQILPDNTTRTNALTSDAVQAIDAVAASDLASFQDPKSVAAVQGFGLIFIMFNSASEAMGDKLNRQAIMHSLDYERICAQGMANLAAPSQSFLHEEHAAFKPAATQYTYDPEKAKEIIAQTGLTRTRLLCSDHGWFAAVRPIIKENVEALGIEVVFEEKQSSDVYSTIDGNPDSFDIVVAPGDPSVFGDDADLLMRWWYANEVWTEQRMNWAGTDAHAQVQELLERGQTVTGDEQLAVWHEAIDIIADDMPLYPLLHRKTPTAYDSETLENFKPISLTGLSFQNVGSTLEA
ncbi:MAG: ABC transporter substrate-binding protein [Propionibacterium sp.]|nr:ABC transporter substrate-binding protein [Propionibacterium sp.]